MQALRDRVVELRRVPAGELRPNPRNWRRHPDGQRRALRDMLEAVGIAAAAIVRETPDGLELIDGHLRQEVIDAGELVPVLVLDVDESEADQLLLSLDPIAGMALTDAEALAELVSVTDIPAGDLERVLTAAGGKRRGRSLDDLPARTEQAEATTQPGDVWTLGEHRLVCGDAMHAETLAALLEGEPAGMVLTDPPFAIYGSSTGVSSEVTDDRMVRPFFEAMFRTIADALGWFGHAYVHCDWRSWSALWEAAKRGGMAPKNCLVWDKGGNGLGNNYANTHEFVGYFAKIPPTGAIMTAGRVAGQRQVLRPNILRFERARGSERLHNAAKPVALLAELIVNGSDAGDLVLDLFGGSGSTLIAAESEGRRARVVEVEPSWCDVIVRRWEGVTGRTAERAGG